jgi:hypothetical protein
MLASSALYYPSLHPRVIEEQFPKHLQVGVSFHPDEIAMHFHTAGTQAIWEIPVVDAAKNERLIAGLSPQDALQLGLYFQQQIGKSSSQYLREEIEMLSSKLQKYEPSLGDQNHG